MDIWLQVASRKSSTDNQGWGLGECIWSPSEDRRGSIRQYKIMFSVVPGDVVINCANGQIVGFSRASAACRTVQNRPPDPGPWAYSRSFFRVELTGFYEFSKPVSLKDVADRFKDEISADIEANRPRYYLFSWYPKSEFYPDGKLALAQGRFLARSTPVLIEAIRSCLLPADRTAFDAQVTAAGKVTAGD